MALLVSRLNVQILAEIGVVGPFEPRDRGDRQRRQNHRRQIDVDQHVGDRRARTVIIAIERAPADHDLRVGPERAAAT
ncbi:MAG: hypothetical protein V9G98_03720, partial [Candidatus Competibacter sp.]